MAFVEAISVAAWSVVDLAALVFFRVNILTPWCVFPVPYKKNITRRACAVQEVYQDSLPRPATHVQDHPEHGGEDQKLWHVIELHA